MTTRPIQIFLASSNELKAEREQFANFIRQRNDLWQAEKGIQFRLRIWEDESTAISPTHSQDEYNRLIPHCDMLVVLAHTKVGIYTGQEFEVGYEHFLRTGKPEIFPYFKKLQPGEVAQDTLGAFRQRLHDGANYFIPKDFEHYAVLETAFWNELELRAKGWRERQRKADLSQKTFVLCPVQEQSVVERILLPALERAGVATHLDFRPFTFDDIPQVAKAMRETRNTLVVNTPSTTTVMKLLVEGFRQEFSEALVAEKLLGLQLGGAYPFDGLPMLADLSDASALQKNLVSLIARLRPEAALLPAPITWPPLPPAHVDILRLPQSGTYVRIFGRQTELALLDRTWEAAEKRILHFHAHGGVGKSQLINRWLHDLGADHYRGATRVLAWTFYSQGTGDKVSSADRFIQYALEWFDDPDPLLGSPWEKGKRLARLAGQHRTLLLLDGLEPLQHYETELRGKLKDPALEAFLRAFARQPQGLCVITSRLQLAGFERFEAGGCVAHLGGVPHVAVEQQNLETLSAEACTVILQERGAKGDAAAFERVSQAFGRHAFAMQLLATWLRAVPGHRIEAAEGIPDLPDLPEAKGRHPRRVIAALYEQLLLEPRHADAARLLPVFGLFDRLVAEEVLTLAAAELPDPPNVPRALAALRRTDFLYDESEHEPGMVDCHPLLREHFEVFLQEKMPDFCTAAHTKLYEYYRALPEKHLPDTLLEMEPLFLAIAHGCRAGLQQRALVEVYWERIQRGEGDNFCCMKLGAFGSDLSALGYFFEKTWEVPAFNLSEAYRAILLNWAGFRLQSLGMLREAAGPLQVSMEIYEKQGSRVGVAANACNLCQLWLSIGDVSAAVQYSMLAVQYATQSEFWSEEVQCKTVLADALHQSGEWEVARQLFEDAEKTQMKNQYRPLYSLQGYYYCDLLLDERVFEDVLRRAEMALTQAVFRNLLLDIATNKLTLGRAHLAQWLSQHSTPPPTDHPAGHWLNEAVDRLRAAGVQEYIPRGLLARAAWHRCRQDYAAAHEDLQEALDIIEEGGMRLFLVDYHIEMMKLASPPGPLSGGEGETAAWHRAEALRLIEETGYRRRLRDLGEE